MKKKEYQKDEWIPCWMLVHEKIHDRKGEKNDTRHKKSNPRVI